MPSPFTYDRLITLLRDALGSRYTLDVEHTGGGVWLLFIRNPGDPDTAGRCAVIDDAGLDEPDPSAPSRMSIGLYADWDDDGDEGLLYENPKGERFDSDQRVVDWLRPVILGWLS